MACFELSDFELWAYYNAQGVYNLQTHLNEDGLLQTVLWSYR